ncbi:MULTISPECIES: hypothetical protein [Stappiaceae]|uniref:hypothetical protein n=1 Tax=Stappiaceae TaxID=2821832 RepID=UPI001446A18D|nr:MULTISPECIES: hypothetical protein [Stappiaceae]NKX66722.1 hypothetical protein [Labrenzia sp. 5N]WJS00518.1 hypothetical protein QUB73_15160 [Roseibium aggregatum]
MLIQRALLAGSALALACANAQAGNNTPKPGDTYIISRDGNQLFRGSHRIYDRMADGLVAVQYCGRSYFVRYATVAWTQLEVQQDYKVRVEFNRGKGWRPICDHPEEQVTLEDLGVQDDPRLVVQNDGSSVKRVNRFAVIREAFKTTDGDNAAKSYHGN